MKKKKLKNYHMRVLGKRIRQTKKKKTTMMAMMMMMKEKKNNILTLESAVKLKY